MLNAEDLSISTVLRQFTGEDSMYPYSYLYNKDQA